MDIIVTGTIVQALPVQSGVSQKTGNQWSTASYIIEHEHGQYPRRMVFDVRGQRIGEMNLQIGETVTLHLNVDCREYNGRYFNSIEAWKVERQAQQQPAPQPQYQQAAPQPQAAPQQFPPQVNQQGYAQPAPAPAPQPQAAPQGNAQQGDLPF